MSLLTEIENTASDSRVPLADLLRKCKILAARLKHEEFSKWVTRELNGYETIDELPPYRKLPRGPSFGHFNGPFGSGLKNAPIPPSHLPEEFRALIIENNVTDPVGSLEDMATKSDKLQWKWPANLVAYVAHHVVIYPNMGLADAWSPIPAGQYAGILDTIRTRVLDFVLAIQAANPKAGESALNDPPPVPLQSITNTFNTTIVGGLANVGNTGPSSIGDGNVASAGHTQNNGVGDATIQQLLIELRSAAASVESADERKEAEGALQKVEVQLARPKPDLERIKNYLAIFQTIVTVAGPTVSKLATYLGPYISSLVG